MRAGDTDRDGTLSAVAEGDRVTALGGLLVSFERPAVDLADSGSVDLDPHLSGRAGEVCPRGASERAGRDPAATSLDRPRAARRRGTNRRGACDPPPYMGESPPVPQLHPPRQDRCPWSKTLVGQSAKRAETQARGLAAAGCRPSLNSAGDIRSSTHPLSARWRAASLRSRSCCQSGPDGIDLEAREERIEWRPRAPQGWPMHVRGPELARGSATATLAGKGPHRQVPRRSAATCLRGKGFPAAVHVPPNSTKRLERMMPGGIRTRWSAVRWARRTTFADESNFLTIKS